MARQPGLNHELVLIDQSQLRQRERELHASHEQSLTRLPLELLNGLPQIPAHELRVPIGLVEVLDRVTMQVLVRDHYAMIAAPVQCDVDRKPKRSHYVRVPPMG